MKNFDDSIKFQTVVSGKLRRYNHLRWWNHLRPSILLPNIIDSFLVLVGIIQSLVRLIIWRPDVMFAKGGFVCVPIGIAAHLLRVPIVIHDSDAHPGLASRILSRWAKKIATGAPTKFYPYPSSKTVYIGTPVDAAFKPFTNQAARQAKSHYEVDADRPLVVVTGGGLGAKRLNDAVVAVIDQLLELTSVILVSGKAQYSELKQKVPQDSINFRLIEFVDKDMAVLLGAADLVVARAGATSILELAALQKPTILVPNARLTGGHQLKNTAVYDNEGAVAVVDDDRLSLEPEILLEKIKEILSDPQLRDEMSTKFHKFAKPEAAFDMAKIVLGAVQRS